MTRRWIRNGLVLVGIVVIGASLMHQARLSPQEPTALKTPATKGSSVLLITLDTVRADHIGAYGSGQPTPAMDALADQGVLFELAVSPAPITQPAHLAILTGQPPHMTGVVANGTDIGDQPSLIQRVLQDAGWATAGFVSAFPLTSRFSWGQGMHTFDDQLSRIPGIDRRERRGDRTVDRALDWLESHADERFFLWVHLFDPHGPYEAPDHPFDPPTNGAALDLPDYWPDVHKAVTDTDWLRRAYAAEVRFADDQVGRLLAALESHGIDEDTVVVLTADHGESLTEHGVLFDHGDDLFDPSLRVPLIVRVPGGRTGLRVSCQVSNMDVTPTVLRLVGVSDPFDRRGTDLTDMVSGEQCSDAPVIATTVSGRYQDPPPIDHALRTRTHKRIEAANGTAECFDLVADPDEQTPMDPCPPDLAPVLSAALAGHRTPVPPQSDSGTTEALKALGYVE